MRPPPSVAYPLKRSAPLALALGVAGCLPLLQALLWWHSQPPATGQRDLASLAMVFAGLWALWALQTWVRWPQGRLVWLAGPAGGPEAGPGQWLWHDARTGQRRALAGLEVSVDIQGHVLLRLRPARGPACWAWASRSADPGQWSDFRRAWTALAR